MYMCVPCACLVMVGARKGAQIPWNWNGGEPPCKYLELNTGLPEEQQGLFTSGPRAEVCYLFVLSGDSMGTAPRPTTNYVVNKSGEQKSFSDIQIAASFFLPSLGHRK